MRLESEAARAAAKSKSGGLALYGPWIPAWQGAVRRLDPHANPTTQADPVTLPGRMECHGRHLFLLLGVFLGLYLLVFHLHNPIAVFIGVLCLLIFVFLVPRPRPYPKNVIDHIRRPALYQAVDDVAEALGAPPPDAILLSADYNAAYGRAGWRRRHVLTLGLPLLTVLDEQETAALIAHELAHAVNGDAPRGFLIGSAATTLSRWYYLLIPDRFSGLNRRRYGLGGMFANGLMLGTAQVVRFAASVMSHLVWHDSQRAEYLADHLAAEAAGTTATIALLEKAHMGGMFQDVVRRATLQSAGANLFTDLREPWLPSLNANANAFAAWRVWRAPGLTPRTLLPVSG